MPKLFSSFQSPFSNTSLTISYAVRYINAFFSCAECELEFSDDARIVIFREAARASVEMWYHGKFMVCVEGLISPTISQIKCKEMLPHAVPLGLRHCHPSISCQRGKKCLLKQLFPAPKRSLFPPRQKRGPHWGPAFPFTRPLTKGISIIPWSPWRDEAWAMTATMTSPKGATASQPQGQTHYLEADHPTTTDPLPNPLWPDPSPTATWEPDCHPFRLDEVVCDDEPHAPLDDLMVFFYFQFRLVIFVHSKSPSHIM